MTTSNYKKKNQSSPLGGTEGGLMKPIKNRKEFFDSLEAGLQSYFDAHDPEWGGIMHLTIGVRCGEVGGIIKSADALRYEGYTRQRIVNVLRFVLPRYVKRSDVDYAVDDVINELLGAPSNSPMGEDSESTEVELQTVVVEPLPEKKAKKKTPSNSPSMGRTQSPLK